MFNGAALPARSSAPAAARPGTREAPLSPGLLMGLVALLDALAVGAGALAAQLAVIGPSPAPGPHAGIALVATVLTLAFVAMRGGYGLARLHLLLRQWRTVLPAFAGAMLVALATAAGFGLLGRVDLGWALAATGGGAALLLAGRGLVAALLALGPASPAALRTVIIGRGPQAARLVEVLRRRGDRSIRLLGLVDDRRAAAAGFAGGGFGALPLLGSLEVLLGMIRRGEVDQVVLALPGSAEDRAMRVLQRLADHPVKVRMAPDLLSYHLPPCGRSEHGDIELLHLLDRPVSGWRAAVKAVEDYALALAALAVCGVPMLLIALAIRLDSPGPVLFRQRRTGFGGRDFDVLKFRTMYQHAADPTVRRQVREGDPRITPVGALLRRSSLDELPQLFNVLKGEMSFVGPRPHAPGTRAGDRPFEEVVARYAARHRVKPGLTGLAQVRGWRGPTETEEKLIRRVESDLEYIERWSIGLDITIILRTIYAVARMTNAH